MKTKMLSMPFEMNGLLLRNRIIMAPMGRSRADNNTNTVDELQVTYYKQRASAGLIITEGVLVSRDAQGGINLPAIYNQEQIDSWRLVTDAVHNQNGSIFIQLWHTGRMSHPFYHNGLAPLAPSPLNPNTQVYIPTGFTDTVIPREMTVQDIKQTIKDFKQAAINAFEAGFDGIELQAGNGYLLHQFFNLYSNNRIDEYGGSIENRARILFELLDSLKGAVPINRIAIRLNPSQNDILGMMLDESSIDVHEYIVKKLNEYDLAYLHLAEPFISVDNHPYGISRVTKHFRPLFKGVIISNGGYNPVTAESAIEDGDADLISFGKYYISNPDLVERISNNWILNDPDSNTFYTGGASGYIDYPSYTTD
ncbi:alkene reductase [Flavobacterium sp. Fl-77]|uniref:Alkene reductase n=1 Tax=Flavobacterium flavipigmentatum TaxID=2893884 RepID=A0AAJ2SAR7_9FLAO|nr:MULTISPECIES: alkene reductase [unclassified Flavobacterium]MDX6182428.1 alkene reductase [Flavobacterium sp. Fl-33]MDX6185659.1 alkene reductase [Flavobacterium sp. Fl-77]UFH38844.1 alkene reductase [Flavobacterium sp. F-70]